MPKNRFDRYANKYSKNRDIQDKIAKRLVLKAGSLEEQKVVDIGCGDGAIFECCEQSPRLFVGVDFSAKMCDLHPKLQSCILVNDDFDDDGFVKRLTERFGYFDILFSSSSLQWSSDFASTLSKLSVLADRFAISVVTSGTFSSLREIASIKKPLLPSVEDITYAFNPFCVDELCVEKYTKSFDSPSSALKYIKNTGVSGNVNALSYKEVKKLYEECPTVLEFEVVYIVGSFKKIDFSKS